MAENIRDWFQEEIEKRGVNPYSSLLLHCYQATLLLPLLIKGGR